MRTTPALRLAFVGLACASLLAIDPSPALAVFAAKAPARHARRVKKFTSLTGAWSGVYRYPSSYAGVDAVPFNARLEETGETFTGEIDEPNTYAHPAAPRLYATVSGERKGLDLSFVKKMDGTGGVIHSIYYEGAADADLTRIDGTWRVADGFSGTFFMERAGVEAEAAAERSASATG
jgi:hypothetical protein